MVYSTQQPIIIMIKLTSPLTLSFNTVQKFSYWKFMKGNISYWDQNTFLYQLINMFFFFFLVLNSSLWGSPHFWIQRQEDIWFSPRGCCRRVTCVATVTELWIYCEWHILKQCKSQLLYHEPNNIWKDHKSCMFKLVLLVFAQSHTVASEEAALNQFNGKAI